MGEWRIDVAFPPPAHVDDTARGLERESECEWEWESAWGAADGRVPMAMRRDGQTGEPWAMRLRLATDDGRAQKKKRPCSHPLLTASSTPTLTPSPSPSPCAPGTQLGPLYCARGETSWRQRRWRVWRECARVSVQQGTGTSMQTCLALGLHSVVVVGHYQRRREQIADGREPRWLLCWTVAAGSTRSGRRWRQLEVRRSRQSRAEVDTWSNNAGT